MSESKWLVLNTDQIGPDAEQFQQNFGSYVIGQPNAEKVALMAFESANNILRDKTKPIGVYVLIGPSRSGKSYTGRIAAKLIHGDENAVTELEGGEYQEEHQVLELKGAPPSYKGYMGPEEKAKLTASDIDSTSSVSEHNLRRVRLNSKSSINVVIINEFEKSHEDFYKFWMGVFDHGKARLGNGEIVDFTNTIFFITMNLGMEELETMANPLGFSIGQKVITEADVKSVVDTAMVRRFKKEFRNRLDAIVIFKPHTGDDLLRIVDKEIRGLEERIAEALPRGKTFGLDIKTDARKWLLDKALSTQGDVAGLKRVLEQELVNKLGRELSKGTIGAGDLIVIEVAPDGTCLLFKLSEKATELAPADLLELPTSSGKTGLSFQRRLHRAQQKVRRNDVLLDLYSLTLMNQSKDELFEALTSLQHDLRAIYELPDLSVFVHKVEPYMATITLKTSAEMMELVREKYPECQIGKPKPSRRDVG